MMAGPCMARDVTATPSAMKFHSSMKGFSDLTSNSSCLPRWTRRCSLIHSSLPICFDQVQPIKPSGPILGCSAWAPLVSISRRPLSQVTATSPTSSRASVLGASAGTTISILAAVSASAGAPSKASAASTAGMTRRMALLLPSGEFRRPLFHEGAHALGIVGRRPRLALQVALEVELLIERIGLGGIERALDQRQAVGGRAGELRAQLFRLRHQRGVVDRLP